MSENTPEVTPGAEVTSAAEVTPTAVGIEPADTRGRRVLLAGWFSFLDGEATAGDLLAWQAVRDELDRCGIGHDTAWSPVFEPGGLTLEDADPAAYTDLVFVCGPAHGAPIERLTGRFRGCRRIAVGVSVVDPADPVLEGFDVLIPRDVAGGRARPDLSAGPGASLGQVPVVGVVLTSGQGEYGAARRHEAVTESVTGWLAARDVAAVPLETRLDRTDWRLAARPGQFVSVLRRMDVVVTTRLHGLVLALANGVPALAIDPVAGGGKVGAQARAWDWPVLAAVQARPPSLDGALRWCLSAPARERARSLAADLTRADAPSRDGMLESLHRALDRPAG